MDLGKHDLVQAKFGTKKLTKFVLQLVAAGIVTGQCNPKVYAIPRSTYSMWSL